MLIYQGLLDFILVLNGRLIGDKLVHFADETLADGVRFGSSLEHLLL